MATILWDWINFGVRWLHVIAGIAWIGSSFYFVHLDASLKRRAGLPQGAGGEAWQVHGGGFYHMVKYMVAPSKMPEDLTWFKWEAYATWSSGFFLLVLLYYAHADIYLVDPLSFDLPRWVAVLTSLCMLVLGWVIYDELCKSRLGQNESVLAALGFVFLVAVAWLSTHLFSGRGAYMQTGALIGTIMAANVGMIIIPNQKKVVASLLAGEAPDPALGIQAKQRSMHNNYLTLPVLFIMLSNHQPLAFASRWNWLIIALVLIVGAVIRHFYNVRHKGGASPWWTWGVAAIGAILIILLSLAGPSHAERRAELPAAGTEVAFDDVQNIVMARCSMCHAQEPLWPGIAQPPKNVVLDDPILIQTHAREIYLQAAVTDAMPPANVTELEPAERGLIRAWYESGARVE